MTPYILARRLNASSVPSNIWHTIFLVLASSTDRERRLNLSLIHIFALVGTPYAFKFVWSPLIDRLPPPLPLAW